MGLLGVIAVYVQNRSVPEEHDFVRTSLTAPSVSARSQEKHQLTPTPWIHQLNLKELSLTPYTDLSLKPEAVTPTPADESPPAEATEIAEMPTPEHSLFVQSLADGQQVLYTLDPVLQTSLEQIFRNREVPYAAAVVLDVRDNAVLAMAAHSTMDPEVNPLQILTTAWAPAASTFKLVTAAALLQSGHVQAHTKACFSGGLRGIPDELLTNDPKRDTQCASLSEAIAHSHNIVIAKLALQHLNHQDLLSMAHALSFDQNIPFEFAIEQSPAHIPIQANERAKVAAGFWHVDLSPLHGALLASVFARDGIFQPPHVIAQVLAPDGSDQTPSIPPSKRVLSQQVAHRVGQMMLGTTTEGTARKSFRDAKGEFYLPTTAVAGKTGSLTGQRAPALNYNWFIGFAPAENPEIAFAVLLANQPQWRIKAHYAGRRVVQIYLERRDAINKHRHARLTLEHGLLIAPPTETKTKMVATSKAEPTEVAKPGKPAISQENEILPPIPGPLPKQLQEKEQKSL